MEDVLYGLGDEKKINGLYTGFNLACLLTAFIPSASPIIFTGILLTKPQTKNPLELISTMQFLILITILRLTGVFSMLST